MKVFNNGTAAINKRNKDTDPTILRAIFDLEHARVSGTR